MTRETPRRGETRQRDTTQDRGSRIERRQETRQESTRQDSTARGSARMSDEQRTRVSTRFSQSIDRMNVRPLSRSQISVSIGATIPRSVRAYTVPRDIVAIYPQFRGHRFVVVDDEIVIVEPGSQRVVTMLPMGGERAFARSPARETTGSSVRETTGTAPPAGSRIRLSPQEREVIRTVVMREPACRLEQRVDFVLFIPLPRTVEVCELPPQVVSEAPEVQRVSLRGADDEIGLVDPDEQSDRRGDPLDRVVTNDHRPLGAGDGFFGARATQNEKTVRQKTCCKKARMPGNRAALRRRDSPVGAIAGTRGPLGCPAARPAGALRGDPATPGSCTGRA